MSSAWEILVLSSDLEARDVLIRILNQEGCDPICAHDVAEALPLLRQVATGLIFCDCQLQDGTYRDLLHALRSQKTKLPVVVTSRLADWDGYLEAMRLGAFDMIAIPYRPADVEWVLMQARREDRDRQIKEARLPALADHTLIG